VKGKGGGAEGGWEQKTWHKGEKKEKRCDSVREKGTKVHPKRKGKRKET